jgi:hypothetical protein
VDPGKSPPSHSRRPFVLVRFLLGISSYLDSVWAKRHAPFTKLFQMWVKRFNRPTSEPEAQPKVDIAKTSESQASKVILGPSGEPPASIDESQIKTSDRFKEYYTKIVRPFLWSFHFIDRHSPLCSALATVAIVGLTIKYVDYSKKQWQVARDTLTISQKASVTIGRKDGVIAEILIPKDARANAVIIIYFQNGGHLPAKFAWGTTVSYLGSNNGLQKSGIMLAHPDKGLPQRSRDIKTGSVGSSGGEETVIAGDSLYSSTLGEISQKDLASLPASDVSSLIFGRFAFCDEIGTDETHTFLLQYKSTSPTRLAFDLLEDSRSPIPPIPPSTATTEYLPRCETTDERQRMNRK